MTMDISKGRSVSVSIYLSVSVFIYLSDRPTLSRSFSRAWTLPDDVNISDLKSSLTETGRLSIEAPKKNPEVTQIPIQNTSSISSSAANPAPSAEEQKKE